MSAHAHIIYSIGLTTIFFLSWACISFARSSIRYRKLWLDMGHKRELATIERDEWIETCRDTQQALCDKMTKHAIANAKARKLITDQAEQIDSLMNGDRRCENDHKFHASEGIWCPHCNASEVPIILLTKCPDCNEIMDEGEGGWFLCNRCSMEFKPTTGQRQEYIPF